MRSDALGSKRALTARPTTITELVAVRKIDRLWLRVQLRAAALGITQKEVARRIGVHAPRLNAICSQPTIRLDTFERLTRALDGSWPVLPAWWVEPLKVPRISQEKMLKAVRSKLR